MEPGRRFDGAAFKAQASRNHATGRTEYVDPRAPQPSIERWTAGRTGHHIYGLHVYTSTWKP